HALLQWGFDIVDDGVVRLIDRGLRLGDLRSWLETREEIDPVGSAIRDEFLARRHPLGHRDGHEHVWPRSDRRSLEPLWSDADDSQRLSVDDERVTDDRAVARESRHPVPMAEHRHSALAGHTVVIAVQKPAGGR